MLFNCHYGGLADERDSYRLPEPSQIPYPLVNLSRMGGGSYLPTSPIPVGPLSSSHVAALSQTMPSPALLSHSSLSYQEAQLSSSNALSDALNLTNTQAPNAVIRTSKDPLYSDNMQSRCNHRWSHRKNVPNLAQKPSPSAISPSLSIFPLLFSFLVLQLSLLTATTLITVSVLKYNRGNNKDPGTIIGAMLSLIVMAAAAFGACYEWRERRLCKAT